MKLRAGICCVLLMMFAVVLASTGQRNAAVEIALLAESNWDNFVPLGKEVDAIYGDAVIRNEHLTAVIAQPLATRNANMTVRDVAGALIDLTVRDSQSDQLSAFYPGKRAYPFRSWKIFLGDRKQFQDDNGPSTASGKSGSIIVRSEGSDNRPAVEVAYELKAGDRFLTVTTTYKNTTSKKLSVSLEDDVRADGGNEDMLKSTGGVENLFWVHDRYWGQAYGIISREMKIQSNSNSRTSVLKYQDASGESKVTLKPGKSYSFTRRIIPGASLLDVKAVVDEWDHRPAKTVRIAVRDGSGNPVPRARIEVSKSGETRGSVDTNQDGKATTRLPAGGYDLKVSALGITVARGLSITVTGNSVQEFKFQLGNYVPGTVSAEITDSSGRPIPCKVEFRSQGGVPSPNFGPISAAFATRNVHYAPHGKFKQSLPPGRYDVIVSRGPEYDAIFTELTVPPGKAVTLRGKLVRSVQTEGWVSSDFHSHSSPSGDNTSSQLGRVLNLVCEHIEFAPCTEHNRISTYEPHIARLKIGKFISTVSGMELTGRPLPLNHQNTFPLKYKPRTQDGGGPVTDVDPERQFERIALWDDRSEKLIQQNHPDMGWLFYDKDGNGKPDNGYERSFPLMDVIEIHPVENALRLGPFETLPGRKGNNRIFNWLQLLNQGFRVPGVVNTDAHYNYHGSGWLRNWVQSSSDNPAEIDQMEMVRAAEQGRLIMSNGPYLEVSLVEVGGKKTVTAGEDISAASGNVELQVRVQCANWLDIDHVFVLVNGRVHAKYDYTRKEHPNRFRSGTVKFDEKMLLELNADSHIVVVAGGDDLTLGPVVGPGKAKSQPAAISNPMFVDIDGDGFRPNRDTLGHPLPVKFGTRK